MESLFFGDSASQLYGVYHSPSSTTSSNRALVMCYPAGHEYMRIHRCYRQIASQLNDQGFHVLRFDYFGTGDSAGDHNDISVSRWVSDTLAAVDELRAISGVRKIDILGARMGAIVASTACARLSGIRNLLLWDPCVSGQDFIDQMSSEVSGASNQDSNFVDANGGINFNGYRFSEKALESIRDAVYPERFPKAPRSVFAVTPVNLNPLVEGIEHIAYDGELGWNSLDEVGGLFLPVNAVRAVVDILTA